VEGVFETELKARARLSEVREALRGLGASLIGVEDQVDRYFSHPCRDFGKSDEALRLRVSNGSCELTYKGPRVGGMAKGRLEVTVRVDDEAKAVSLLRLLGFEEVATVRKRRERYSLPGVELCLDSVEGLGEFVEAESRGLEASHIESLLKRIGAGELVRETYLELLLSGGLHDER